MITYQTNYNILLKSVSMSYLYLSRIIIVEVRKSVHGMNPPFIENVFMRKSTKYNISIPRGTVKGSLHTMPVMYGILSNEIK